jgi:hypothetical protein
MTKDTRDLSSQAHDKREDTMKYLQALEGASSET